MADRPTLLRQRPDDPNKAPIENALEVTELAVLGPVSGSSENSIASFSTIPIPPEIPYHGTRPYLTGSH